MRTESYSVLLETARLIVRTPQTGDGHSYADYYRRNREFLQPWSPTFGADMFIDEEWESSIPLIQHEFSSGRSARFCLYLQDRMIGVANLTSITRSPAYSALLGYTLAEDVQGMGYMREALDAILQYAMGYRNLHRISANYMPHNQRSGGLLRSLGFQVEGYARDYLLIDGKWQDHVLTTLTNFDWVAPA